MAIPRIFEEFSILIVDDEEDSLEVAWRLVKKSGAQVQTAPDGQTALNLIRQQRPDFVISDLSMPIMDGWMLIDELRKDPSTANLPLIALTAHAMVGDRERAIQAGFVNYISKPLEPDKFVQQLAAIVKSIPELSDKLKTEG